MDSVGEGEGEGGKIWENGIELKRIAIGGLALDFSLKEGEARFITEEELKMIEKS